MDESGREASDAAGRRAARWVGAASVAGVVASVCCLGPIVLAALGIPAAGFAAAFESVRPWFLGLTAVLLGSAFYAAYGRGAATGAACAVPGAGRVRRTRRLLWLASGAAVVVALFPTWAGLVLRVGAASAESPRGGVQTLELRVHGMACEACGAAVAARLRRVPGVLGASVHASTGRAVVTSAADAPPVEAALVRAVEEAGYQAVVPRRAAETR